MISWLTVVGTAWAQGLSVDVEMMKPTFSAGSHPGVDSPVIAGAGAMRTGFLTQYTRDPVILYQFDQEYGVVVRNRTTVHLGWEYDLSDRVALRGTVPLAFQIGSDENVQSFGAPGLGMGDLMIGGRVQLAQAGPLTVGFRGDAMLPVGTNEAWLGDAGFRGVVGVMALASVGQFDIVADLGSTVRAKTVESTWDFTGESTLDLNASVAYHLWPNHIALQAAWLQKGGVSSFGQGGGENGSEAVGGLRLTVNDGDIVDLGVGKGVGPGVGTSAFRAFVGYTWVRPPQEPPPEPVVVVIEEPPEPVPEPEPWIPEDPPEPEWEPEEKAKVVGDQVVIREPIQFEFATDNILPESLDTLLAVADILNENAQIEHVVIEGHASEEGSFEYNYNLSNLRARAIWKELMGAGVHPDRISYRGMGEVVPKVEGAEEEQLAVNRRVEFHIIDWVDGDEDWPEYGEFYRLPWTGETITTVQPTRPEKEPDPEEMSVEDQLDELLNPDQFLEEALNDDEVDETDDEVTP